MGVPLRLEATEIGQNAIRLFLGKSCAYRWHLPFAILQHSAYFSGRLGVRTLRYVVKAGAETYLAFDDGVALKALLEEQLFASMHSGSVLGLGDGLSLRVGS